MGVQPTLSDNSSPAARVEHEERELLLEKTGISIGACGGLTSKRLSAQTATSERDQGGGTRTRAARAPNAVLYH